VVVCDTGPILHLHEAGGLGLLQQAGEIILPKAVDAELIALLPEWSKGRPAYLRVVAVSPDEGQWMDLCQSMGLGAGESEAVALARSMHADWLLTDDAAARVVGTLMGLQVHGSLGVILWAAAARQVDCARAFALLDRLAKSSLWISPRIIDEARQALTSLFA
jgi:predicted nucleic acid-binding protein